MVNTKRFYLDCPYEDKDECKSLGGYFDLDVKKWYVPDNVDKDAFSKWFPGQNEDYVEPKVVDEEDKVFLDVEFSEKAAVKKTGAKWDAHAKKWYCLKEDRMKFRQWWHPLSLEVVEADESPF